MKIYAAYNEKEQAHGWKISVTINGVYHRKWFPSKEEAEEFVHKEKLKRRQQKLGLFVAAPQQQLTVMAAMLSYREHVTGQRTAASTVNRLLEFFALFPDLQHIGEISIQHVTTYKASLMKRKLRSNTVNDYLTKLGTFFNYCKSHHPAALREWTPPAIDYLNWLPGRDRILTIKEAHQLYHGLRTLEFPNDPLASQRQRHLADLFALSLLCGTRQEDWYGMTSWASVNFDWHTLTLQSKTQTRRTLPMMPTVEAILKRRRQLYPVKPFPIKTDPATQHRQLQRISQHLGIAFGNDTPGGWVFHDLRHTAATVMHHHGIPFMGIAYVLGHQTARNKAATFTYLHATPELVKQAMLVLEKFWLSCRDFDETQQESTSFSAIPREFQFG